MMNKPNFDYEYNGGVGDSMSHMTIQPPVDVSSNPNAIAPYPTMAPIPGQQFMTCEWENYIGKGGCGRQFSFTEAAQIQPGTKFAVWGKHDGGTKF